MKSPHRLLSRSILLLLLAAPAFRAMAAGDSAQLERGRYLVERAILCVDCHSPRNEKGEFVMEHWLKGAALPFAPTVDMPWSPVAPPIAGLPSMTAEEGVRFLMEGTRPDGTRARPPMPEFRLNAEDARAVVAYLKSLQP